MLNQIKRLIINQLWQDYIQDLPYVVHIQAALHEHYAEALVWDHFALIDLPGPYTGIESLCQLFFQLDYEFCGQDYLAEKQNEFAWLADKAAVTQDVRSALPQVVVADFRREALLPEVQKIVDTYVTYTKPLDIDHVCYLKKQALAQDEASVYRFVNWVVTYLTDREWPLPSVEEFTTVKASNELLAWVLVMGRRVNHFAWAIHLSKNFKSLHAFNQFIHEMVTIAFNTKKGLIKGCAKQGIEQSSTAPRMMSMHLADGTVNLPNRFIEFVWRYSLLPSDEKPVLWGDYFTGFVANNADIVVESLYEK